VPREQASASLPPFWRPGDPVEPLVRLLDRGGVLAIPSESSYGLGVDPLSREGVKAVYRIKGREAGKPLPVVVADLAQLRRLGIASDLPILKLLSALWPAALSAVLPLAGPPPPAAVAAAAGTGSLAVRIPAHRGLRTLLAELGRGLTATSANRSGGEPALDAPAAARLLAGEDAMVVDAGLLPGGPPSTLVAPSGSPGGGAGDGNGALRVLRAGSFPLDRLRERLVRDDRNGRNGG
jgi:L-threonylcarbamoyladenylate synthase